MAAHARDRWCRQLWQQPSEECTVRAEAAVSVSAIEFVTEAGFDYIKLGDVHYSGRTGPLRRLQQTESTMLRVRTLRTLRLS